MQCAVCRVQLMQCGGGRIKNKAKLSQLELGFGWALQKLHGKGMRWNPNILLSFIYSVAYVKETSTNLGILSCKVLLIHITPDDYAMFFLATLDLNSFFLEHFIYQFPNLKPKGGCILKKGVSHLFNSVKVFIRWGGGAPWTPTTGAWGRRRRKLSGRAQNGRGSEGRTWKRICFYCLFNHFCFWRFLFVMF